MNFPFFHVDAFADQPFNGNPAGVCLLSENLPLELMFKIAVENNLAETGFVQKKENKFSIRWFTPSVELPLCGHGTLAAAHILWQEKLLNPDQVLIFETMSGDLTVKRLPQEWIELNFPKFSSEEIDLPDVLKKIFPKPVKACFSHDRYLIELNNEQEVRNFHPSFEDLADHRVVITSRTDPGSPFDFVSRYFAFPIGVPEDPVTGSAHCSLGPYWSEILGKTELLAYQASSRGGVLKVSVKEKNVLIAGKAITVIAGEYTI